MLAGHYGVGFALKRFDRMLSLGILFLAVQFSDILWTIFVLLGVEKVQVVSGITKANSLNFIYYPFSHSLVATLIWSALVFVLFTFLPPKYRGKKLIGGIVAGLAVFSHFVLDLIVHIPDLPLAGNSSLKIGLGLWNIPWLSWIAEWIILFGGLLMYLRATKGRSFWGKYGPWVISIILAILQVVGSLNPPPSNPRIPALIGLIMYLLTAYAGFTIDKNRIPSKIKIIETSRPYIEEFAKEAVGLKRRR
jgi:hypothetical protein